MNFDTHSGAASWDGDGDESNRRERVKPRPEVQVQLGPAVSLTSNEHIATQALAQLAAGVAANPLSQPTADSIVQMADQLSALEKHEATVPLEANADTSTSRLWRTVYDACIDFNPHRLPPGVRPLSRNQRLDCHTGNVVFTRTQAAQIYLTLLNPAPLLVTTTIQQQSIELGGANVTYHQERTIDTWRRMVGAATEHQQRARALRALSGTY
ncbi:hypothetical protein DFH09DRAFT_1348008 [Mycena vulgaris]|nr:hypothetical protein DFH09DRAFT_1348008 [Mycena vulgaris]